MDYPTNAGLVFLKDFSFYSFAETFFFFLHFWQNFFLFLHFWRNLFLLRLTKSFFTFLTKLLFFLAKHFIWRNFIWQTPFGEVSFGELEEFNQPMTIMIIYYQWLFIKQLKYLTIHYGSIITYVDHLIVDLIVTYIAELGCGVTRV